MSNDDEEEVDLSLLTEEELRRAVTAGVNDGLQDSIDTMNKFTDIFKRIIYTHKLKMLLK